MTQRVLKVTRGDTEHDPMFTPHWMDGYEALLPPEHPLLAQPAAPEPTLEVPPIAPEQHNDHVWAYWLWRFDRPEVK